MPKNAFEGDPVEGNQRLAMCKLLIAGRKLIGEHLGFEACPCPTWDVLLDLYAALHEGRTTYLWSLCVAANIPMSSAHRKITELIGEDVLGRSGDDADGRRVAVHLEPSTITTLDRLFDALAPLAAAMNLLG